MTIHRFFRVIITLGAYALGSNLAVAAEIRNDPSSGGAVLEGKIERGDLEKITSFIFNGDGGEEIYLASPGGDLVEAMKIGRLVRALKLTAVVPDKSLNSDFRDKLALRHGLKDSRANYLCTSACFFVFVAGIYRESDLVGDNPLLGIHRPYLSQSDLRGLRDDQAIVTANSTKTTVETYLRDMGVPAKYADEMFAVSKDEVRWINNSEFVTDFNGFIPQLKDWVDARCDKLTDVEKIIWKEQRDKFPAQQSKAEKVVTDSILKKLHEQDVCESNVRLELALHAFVEALEKRNAPK